MSQRRQRFLKASDGFPVDRAGKGLGAGLLKVGDRLRPILAQERMVGQPVVLERTPSKIARSAPRRGQHSAEVLAEIGLSEPELLDLKSRGVI